MYALLDTRFKDKYTFFSSVLFILYAFRSVYFSLSPFFSLQFALSHAHTHIHTHTLGFTLKLFSHIFIHDFTAIDPLIASLTLAQYLDKCKMNFKSDRRSSKNTFITNTCMHTHKMYMKWKIYFKMSFAISFFFLCTIRKRMTEWEWKKRTNKLDKKRESIITNRTKFKRKPNSDWNYSFYKHSNLTFSLFWEKNNGFISTSMAYLN